MSGLLFLGSQDFTVNKGTNGNILCHNIPGFSLILFYSTQCDHCKSLIPIFKQLPGSVGGCQFGMINVSSNKACVRMSKDTIAPISYVPYILLYIAGIPYMRYNGPYDGAELRRFVIEVANKVQEKQKFSEGTVIKDDKKTIPSYSMGIPLCGQDSKVCYLPMEDAYPGKK
jgi:thiol-disulfide isomerase/thioredoxin